MAKSRTEKFNKIVKYMEQRGMTLAELCEASGVRQASMQSILRGYEVCPHDARKIANALNTRIGTLFFTQGWSLFVRERACRSTSY
jgi:transcriptional regulator with XRE-family HTH domain